MLLVTITYKLVLVIFALGVLIFRPALVMTALEPVWAWCILGIVLNGAFIGFYILLVLCPGAVERMLDFSIRHPGKLLGRPGGRRSYLPGSTAGWPSIEMSPGASAASPRWYFVSHC